MSIDIKNINQKVSSAPQKKRTQRVSLGEFLNRDISLFGKGLNDKKKERFYSELTILLSSGIDMRTSLEIIVKEQTVKKEKELFEAINDGVVKGESFSEAVQKSGKFSPYEYYSLKIGEESGKMHDVLQELTGFYARKIQQRRKISGALTYPVIVLITAIGAVGFMLGVIVPMFVDVFNRFGGELPALTQTIVNISSFFRDNFLSILLFIVLLIVTLFFVRKYSWYRAFMSELSLRVPVMGKIIKKIYLSRFFQSMALLTGAKTPILRSIQLIRNMIRFYPMEKAFIQMEHDILHGILLHQSMEKFPVFDKRTIALVKVAEEVNQLDQIFLKLNRQYSDELEHQVGQLSNLLEPALIIFVGVLVAVILIAMYLPMFQLSNSFF